MGKKKTSSGQRLGPAPIPTPLPGPSSIVPVPDEPDSPIADVLLQDTADVLEDGRVSVNLNSKLAQVFAKLIEASEDEEPTIEPPPAYSTISDQEAWSLPLNIVIQVVGSRGDVQPFLALGNELQRSGHRVRLATHNVFRDFVRAAGLEFYPIGGDPVELMAYMVKNPGLLPRMKTLREGDVGKNRKMIKEILEGCWASCISPDPETEDPFVANAIIANPPSFSHVHCAQALGIPLHIMFTMPWSPTRAFAHPLANLRNSSTDPKLANYISYGMVQLLTWNGIGDVVQSWRKKIDLEAVPMSEAPFLMETLQIPHTYCWSPALVPKPKDWGKNIDVCGYLFRDPPAYTPAPDLDAFLKAGPAPIYIGFGSIVIEDPDRLINILLDSIRECGVRAIISKGWSNLQSFEAHGNVFFLGECPHEWLFQKVRAVVHHGGAGTTACGLLHGRPTVVVPFFGDQPFWGHMIMTSGAGPAPIPHRKLNSDNLSQAIQYCLREETERAAQAVGEKMREEHGVKAAVSSFHRHLPVENMRCDLITGLPATWEYTKSKRPVRLSGAAAEILIQSRRIKAEDLRLYRSKPIIIENRRWDFVTSAISSQLELSYDILAAFSGFWRNPRALHKAREQERRLARASTRQPGDAVSIEEETGESSSKNIAKMVGASAMSIPQLHGTVVKGFLVDVPVAVAEGLRNTPKLYGEKVPDHRPVTDWKSGFIVAGSTFAHQLAEGLTDIFVQPAKGLSKEGVVGFGKGIAKGSLQTITKPSSAFLGLIGYTSQGIYKSIYAASHSRTKKSVASARRVQDKYFVRASGTSIDPIQVVGDFDKISLRGTASDTSSLRRSVTSTIMDRTATSMSAPASLYSGESSLPIPTADLETSTCQGERRANRQPSAATGRF